ncbi:MAG: glycoside hydrolase family 5 protein [Candidatus Omnitrophica bacterium]|nr:glycoside hydrolase family 5 protein [Candidatus Omnitrophota bacterium]
MNILRLHNGRITDGVRPVSLKGINLGGWLMPEGYFMHAPNRGYHLFRKAFVKALGEDVCREKERAFREAFITPKDLAAIAGMGFNSIRLPFHFGLIETSPYVYSHEGVGYLDRAICWARQNNLRVILDMHAAPGAQNHDWHSDSDGKARFWTNKGFQRRAAALWGFLADRYKNEPAVAGYDLLNEAVLDDTTLLNAYYKAAIREIRSVDKAHIIFVEGNHWAQDLTCLDNFDDNNLALSFHFYEPLEFTFNFVPGLKYPLCAGKGRWDRAFMHKRLESFVKLAGKQKRALCCGEFGVNSRDGFYGEDVWLSDILAEFKAMDIHWTYWTWKAVKHFMYPDGVYSYTGNPAWVNRPGPVTGWDTWSAQWSVKQKEMIASWKTGAFSENKAIARALRAGLK